MQWHDDESRDDMTPDQTEVVCYLGKTPRMGEVIGRAVGPQAFLVAKGPGVPTLPVHYHPINQFQVFVRGGGKFGGHQIKRWSVHYSDCLTPYGPIVPGEHGVAFLTLRAQHDSGASYMPESRDDLATARQARPPAPRRNASFTLEETAANLSAGELVQLLAHDDELSISLQRLAPSDRADLAPVGGQGAYVLTLSDCLDADDRTRPVGSIAWADPGEDVAVRATEQSGALFAVLQFPQFSPA